MITLIPNRLLALYHYAPFAVRLHVNIRWNLFPFQSLVPYIPPFGNFAEIGCGYGLWSFYMALLSPQAQIIAIDPDAKRVSIAQNLALQHKIHNIQFQLKEAQECEIPECAVITVIDVLYLIPFQEQENIINYPLVSCIRAGVY